MRERIPGAWPMGALILSHLQGVHIAAALPQVFSCPACERLIKKVIMVVPVLMTNCQVSLKWKNGPVRAQPRIIPTASSAREERHTEHGGGPAR